MIEYLLKIDLSCQILVEAVKLSHVMVVYAAPRL
jgi:hypothetical protein